MDREAADAGDGAGCYEASSVGYEIYRWVPGFGAECDVVAPSLIPKKAGNHVKTDARDAKELLSLYEADY